MSSSQNHGSSSKLIGFVDVENQDKSQASIENAILG
jgi:hypothetical protein